MDIEKGGQNSILVSYTRAVKRYTATETTKTLIPVTVNTLKNIVDMYATQGFMVITIAADY